MLSCGRKANRHRGSPAGFSLPPACPPRFLPNTPDRLALRLVHYLDGAGGAGR